MCLYAGPTSGELCPHFARCAGPHWFHVLSDAGGCARASCRGADQQALQSILDGYRSAKSKVIVYEWCEGGSAVYVGREEEDEEDEEDEEGAVKRPELPEFLAGLWGGKMPEVSI